MSKVTNIEELETLINKVKKAQQIFADFPQEKIDEIFQKASLKASSQRIPLAKDAVEETGMGIVEDKVVKNHFASEYIYNKYKDIKTCGVLEEDESLGIVKLAEPIGLIAGVVPTTNPTSTAIFKALIALKTRNGIIFSPHPRAKNCTIKAAKIVLDEAVKAGAPKDIIGWIDEPTVELSGHLMKHPQIDIILATGGPGMVKAAYCSGKPALGVGPGNTPVVIDETADIQMAVSSILMSKTFDNGVVCASEQSVIVVEEKYDEVKKEFADRGAYILDSKEKEKIGKTVIQNGAINPKIVGQSAYKIAEIAGIKVPEDTKVLIGEAKEIGENEEFAFEKLSPVLGLYSAKDFEDGVQKASDLINFGGKGHTSVVYTDNRNESRIKYFGDNLNTVRVLVNMPASQGAIGDVYNFGLEPSLTLGCGSWGGNSTSENVGIKHLINIKTIAKRRENMLWFKVPPKIYFKYGCLATALQDLQDKKRALIITDKVLFDLKYTDKVTLPLEKMGMETEIFYDVTPDPTTSTVSKALELINAFKPDTIIALGGGSPIDAAKIAWLMYEQPQLKFEDLALRFMDIEKRIFQFPELGKKSNLVAIPTTSGTGSEVTPFSVITDDETGIKYPIADYSLTPSMAIVDPEFVVSMPRSLASASGIDALTHALEAFVSATATDFTNGLALEAIQITFDYLPASYKDGGENLEAREKVHYGATIAGMAFANGFLGVCHSMAHKLGSAFHIPHGIANALLICQVIKYNSNNVPSKQAYFPQYKYPQAKKRYAKIADMLNLGGKNEDEKVDNLIKAIQDLKKKLDIPLSIKDWGVKKTDFEKNLDELSELAFDDQCTGANPRYPLIKEIKEIYLKAFEGEV